MRDLIIRSLELWKEKERLKVLKFNPELTDEENFKICQEEKRIKNQLKFYREMIRRISENDKNKQNISK